MEDINEKIQKLRYELSGIFYLRTVIVAQMGFELDLDKVRRARSEEIVSELERLIPMRIAELKAEQAVLEKEYLKFGKRLKYVFRAPEKVSAAKNRHKQIDFEIRDLEYYLD